MGRSVSIEAPQRLLELSLGAGPVAAPGVEPGDGDMNEALQEISLAVRGVAPLVLELLVGLEVLACTDQFKSALEAHDVDYPRP